MSWKVDAERVSHFSLFSFITISILGESCATSFKIKPNKKWGKNPGAYSKEVFYCVVNSLVVFSCLIIQHFGQEGAISHRERTPDGGWVGQAADPAYFCLRDLAIFFHLVPEVTVI